MDQVTPDYGTVLGRLATSLPRLATCLQQAEGQRAKQAGGYATGSRFRGLEELLGYLNELLKAFANERTLLPLAVLVERSRSDLHTAIEATLSGYVAVAADAMRDVMEIENLLLDFAVDQNNIGEWLRADPRTLRRKYSAAAVRDRLHAAREGRYASTAESTDYRAHSAALHVTPHRDPVALRGFSSEAGWAGDAGFWEIFEHMRRLRVAVERLTSTIAPDSPAHQIAVRELADVDDAWRRTQEMQAMYIALLNVVARSEGEADTPTAE